MNRAFAIFLFLLTLLIGCTKEEKKDKTEFSINIVDDLGVAFKSSTPPNKIVSLAPNLTEMIFELGVESKLVGNTKYCNFPKEALEIKNVGDLITVDYEKIIELNPDLIFITTEGNSKATYDKLQKLGFKLFVSNPHNFDGIKKTFRDISKIFMMEQLAKEKINSWDKIVSDIYNKAQNTTPVKGMFMISLKPVMLAGGNTFVSEFLKTVGIKNIAENSEVNYPLFNREEILLRNPEIIIHTNNSKEIENEILENYPEWKKIAAIKNKNIIKVNPDLFFRPGPRYPIAAKDLWEKLKTFNKK
jgi:iron complex transport system substrate-binding protein